MYYDLLCARAQTDICGYIDVRKLVETYLAYAIAVPALRQLSLFVYDNLACS